MIRERILIDTGPVVALLAESDAEHTACVEQSRELPPPFFTSWPVLTEAAWLLRQDPGAIPRLLSLVNQGLLECLELDAAACQHISSAAIKYHDLRPDFADLTLLYLADREGIATIFTLDRRDFAVYRDAQGRPFHLIP